MYIHQPISQPVSQPVIRRPDIGSNSLWPAASGSSPGQEAADRRCGWLVYDDRNDSFLEIIERSRAKASAMR